jgi:uncharacterized repeat protein (TIGR01451 family)
MAFDPIQNMVLVTGGFSVVGIKDQGDQAAQSWVAQSACEHSPNTVRVGPMAAPELGKAYFVGWYFAPPGHIYQCDIATGIIDAENDLSGALASDMMLDSDNGGATMNRLMAVASANNGNSIVHARYCIPWSQNCPVAFGGVSSANDLAISVSSITPPLDNQGGATAGQPLTYTLAITNKGPGDLAGVSVGDVLPPGLAFVSATVSQGYYSISENAFVAGLGGLTNHGSSTVTLTVLPTMGACFTHAATVGADYNNDPHPANNTVDLSFCANPVVSIRDASALEPNAGTVPMSFAVNLSAPSYDPITVSCFPFDLTAQAYVDYLPVYTNLLFNPGQTNQTVNVQVLADPAIDGDEFFWMLLSNPTNAVLSANQNTAVGTIVDTNGPVVLYITAAGTNVLLSWSTNITGFVLEAADDLQGFWSQVFTPVSVVGNQNVVTNAALSTRRYYRLRK